MKNILITPSVTRKEAKSLTTYLKDIKPLPRLTADEEFQLFAELAESPFGTPRHEALRLKIINANLRFVVSVAKKYQGLGIPLEDLISIGNEGLIDAVGKYDHTRGFKFISYAVWWIRQNIINELGRVGGAIRIPGHKQQDMRNIAKVEGEYLARLGRLPNDVEIAQATELSEHAVAQLRGYDFRPGSLDRPFLSREGVTDSVGDMMPSTMATLDDAHARDHLSHEMRSLIGELRKRSPRHAEVVERHFGVACTPTTLDDLAQDMEVSRERVRQMKYDALRAMRKIHNTKITK